MPAGRPTDFKSEYIEQAVKLAKLGATDVQMADIFGVTTSTFYLWRNTHPEFSEALKTGKEELDNRVEQSLFHRAMGFERDAVKIFLSKGGTPVTVPYREQVPPDTTACIFWLKNRRRAEWRDKIELDHTTSPIEALTEAELRDKLAGLTNDAKSTDRSDPNS